MTQPPRRLFAVIPAAGHSRRMGQPKLLLPLGEKTVIARLLDALAAAGVAACYVVLRGDDVSLYREVVAAGGIAVQPETAPPDMRTSVEHGLAEIRRRESPADEDGWLLTPADHPLLDRAVLGSLLEAWRQTAAPVLVPTYDGRRGHPTFFRWALAAEVAAIPPHEGLNWLVTRHQVDVFEFPVASPAVVTDLDTPADYERLLRQRADS